MTLQELNKAWALSSQFTPHGAYPTWSAVIKKDNILTSGCNEHTAGEHQARCFVSTTIADAAVGAYVCYLAWPHVKIHAMRTFNANTGECAALHTVHRPWDRTMPPLQKD